MYEYASLLDIEKMLLAKASRSCSADICAIVFVETNLPFIYGYDCGSAFDVVKGIDYLGNPVYAGLILINEY